MYKKTLMTEGDSTQIEVYDTAGDDQFKSYRDEKIKIGEGEPLLGA